MATIDNLDRNTWMLTKVSANLSCASHLFLLALKSLKDYKPQDWLRIASAFSLSVDPYDSQVSVMTIIRACGSKSQVR